MTVSVISQKNGRSLPEKAFFRTRFPANPHILARSKSAF
jgi:hypothetical protein